MCEVFLENDIIRNSDLTDDGLLAYVGLRIMANNQKIKDYVLYDYITYCLCGITGNDNLKKYVKNGIVELEHLGLINVLVTTNLGKEVDLSNIMFSVNKNDSSKFKYFTKINKNELFTILNSSEKFKIRILRYFICMLSTLNHSQHSGDIINQYTNVGCQSIRYLADIAKVSKDAAIHYNKFLEKNQLIYICRSDKFVANNNGSIEKNFTNCYGRPKDKYSINSFQWKVENRYNANTGIKLLSDDVNIKRSMKMKFYQLKIGKGLKYSIEELNKIKEYMTNANHNTTVRKQGIIFSDDDFAIVNNRITELQKSQKEGVG